MFEFVAWNKIGYRKVNIIGRQQCLQLKHGYDFLQPKCERRQKLQVRELSAAISAL